jgi:5,10-methylenetetrahydrofolate reductase
MKLKDKLLHSSAPITLFEVVPPPAAKPESLESTIAEVEKIAGLVDGINLPEIHDEDRGTPRTHNFVHRVEPRVLGAGILRKAKTEIVVNRCVVYDPDQAAWFRKTLDEFAIENFILVGGESSKIRYPGPTVSEAAQQVRAAQLPVSLGGITIPSRLNEAERIRGKSEAGINFFTTQVLFDSNDIVALIHRLNGLEARIFLSFAPVSHPRDLEVLRWLGVDIPAHLDRFLLRGEGTEDHVKSTTEQSSFDRSLKLAQHILMDVYDNLPPDPPAIGLNIEHINRRNFGAAVNMLDQLGKLYAGLVAARARGSQG